jgi:hypothetical protein
VNSFVVHGVGHDSGANAGGGGVSIAHSIADGGSGCGALRVTTSSTGSASASSGGDRAAITANSVASPNNAGGSSDNDNIDDDDDDLVNDHVIISHVTYLITTFKYLA